MNIIEREEQLLEDEYNAGEISQKEFNRLIKELHNDYREQAEEAAQNAYDDEMENW